MCEIIAEIASGHNGDVEMAKALIDSASRSGADIVKFQDWRADNVPDLDSDKGRYKRYEFQDEWYDELVPHCEESGVEFMTTCFNVDRVAFLASKGIKKIKIASISLTNDDLLMFAGLNFDEVIVSTAMHTREQVEHAIDLLETNAHEYTIMHCVANYPLAIEDANLARIDSLKGLVGDHGSVGYSDHSLDVGVAKVALCGGIKYIEKHFTLSRDLPQTPHQMYEGGPLITTHEISIEPNEMKEIAQFRDKVRLVMGSGLWVQNEVEQKIKDRYSKRYGI